MYVDGATIHVFRQFKSQLGALHTTLPHLHPSIKYTSVFSITPFHCQILYGPLLSNFSFLKHHPHPYFYISMYFFQEKRVSGKVFWKQKRRRTDRHIYSPCTTKNTCTMHLTLIECEFLSHPPTSTNFNLRVL